MKTRTSPKVERDLGLAVLLLELDVRDGRNGLEVAEPNDDRDGDAVDRDELEVQPLHRFPIVRRDRSGRWDGAEQQMHAILPIGQALGRTRGDPDRLGFPGSEGHPARRVDNHILGLLVACRRIGDVDELPVGRHPPELDGDSVGRRLVSDIVEHDLGALPAVEHDPGGGDEEIADTSEGRRSEGEKRSGQHSRPQDLGKRIHPANPHKSPFGRSRLRHCSGMVYFRFTMTVSRHRITDNRP